MSKIVKSKVTASKAAVPKKALTQKPVETDDESSADSSPASTLASDASDSSDAEDVASAAESDSDDSAESSSEEESSDDDEEIDIAALAASAASRLTQLARASTPSAAAGISTSDILGISSSSAGPVNATARFFVPSSSGSVSLVTAFTATASAADSAAATGAAAAASGSSYVFTTSTLRSTASDPLKALEARVAELQETVGGETGVASKDERRAAAKAAKKDTAGKRWYDLPATEMTPDMKRDLLILRHRGVLDPSKHYRRETSELPKYFQIGTVIAGNAEPNNTKSRRERKRTLVEEVLGDAEAVEHLRSRADNTRAKEARRTGGPARRGRK